MQEYLMKNWLKTPENTSKNHPFNSSSQRIIKLDHSIQSPGPGAYDPPCADIQRTSKYHVERQKKSPINKQFMWMFGSDREEGFKNRDNNILMGPGAYNAKGLQKTNHYSWAKASRFKQTFLPVNDHSPGPGDYQYKLKSQSSSGAQFVFKSKLKKSLQFFPQKSDRQSPSKERLRNSEIEDNYESQKKLTKRSEQKSSVFASKVPRFMTESSSNCVGPGAYDVQAPRWSRLKTQQFPKVFKFKRSKAPLFRQKAFSQIGPGSYNMNKYALSRQLQFKGYPISRQTRFNFKGKKTESTIIPGPGSYMQNKYVYLKQRQVQEKKHRRLKTSTIQISQKRFIKQEDTNESTGPGLYNLNSYDIEFRMRKKIQHAKKLKLMEISVPAFNSKVPRLK